MKEYKYSDLFMQDSIDKQLIIEFDGGTITNEDLHSEQFELQESICSEVQLAFGSCETSQIKFRVSNIFNLPKGTWLKVSMILNGNADEPFVFGRYKVDTSTPTADRSFRDVVAYDSMNDIINADVAEWYNGLSFPMTLKAFRDKFFSHMGIIQQEISLINDNMVVEKTIEPSVLSGRDVCVSICQINGCFGHIGNDGLFQYIFLKEIIPALYPANNLYPADDSYPKYPNTTKILNSTYINCKYEDYIFKKITRLQIRKEENDVGAMSGEEGNTYVIENNFLVYGKSASDLQTICDNTYSVIKGITYRPFECTAKGNPCLVVAEPVRIITKYQVIESYILKRNLKGIQSLKDSYYADGEEIYSEKVNSVKSSIVELKGKTNVLERTVEETRSEIEDMEQGLSSRITQTAESIESEVSRATKAEQGLSSRITQNAEGIETEVARAKNAEESLLGDLSTLSSRITQTAEEISSEVTRAKGAEQQLSSSITQTAQSISTKVEKGEVISEINQSAEQVKIKASKIALEGTVTANGNVEITTDGKLKAVNGSFNGSVTATSMTVYDSISMLAAGLGITIPTEVVRVESGKDNIFPVQSTYRLSLYDTVRIGNVLIEGKLTNSFYGNLVGKADCTDGASRYPIGTSNSDSGFQVAYINSKEQNDSGSYYVTVNGRWGSSEYASHNIVSASSDIRLKENIFDTKIENALEIVNKFRVREFDWKQSGAHQEIGFIADELQEVDERLVIGGGYEEDGTPNYKTVDGFYMQGYLVKALQELSVIAENQQTEIDELKKSVSFLMEKLGGMQSE